MLTAQWIAIGIGVAACVTDLRSRTIPNWLTFGAALAAFCYHALAPQGDGLAWSVAGWFVGAAVFFLAFALGGLGAGDVKLIAALGAWMGPRGAMWICLYAGVAGGVMAIAVSISAGYLRQAVSNVWMLLQHWRVMGLRPLHELSLEGSEGPRLAYAVPIFAGLMMTLWQR